MNGECAKAEKTYPLQSQISRTRELSGLAGDLARKAEAVVSDVFGEEPPPRGGEAKGPEAAPDSTTGHFEAILDKMTNNLSRIEAALSRF